MEDVLSCSQTQAHSSQPSCPADAPSRGSQEAAAAGTAFTGHTAPSVAEASAQGIVITSTLLSAPVPENQVDSNNLMEDILSCSQQASALSEKQADKDHPMEDFSPAQDYPSHLSAHQLSIPALPSPPHSTRLSGVDTRYLIFQNLTSGITIDDIAERLSAPAAEGGCGVSIVSSAPVPSINSAAFVTEFASIHEARLVRAGWSSDNPMASVDAAPSPLLLTIELKPYQRPPAGASRLNKNSRQGSYSPKPSTSNRTSIGSRAAPHRPSPYPYPPSSRPPRPLAAHNRFGYMARKGLISDRRGTSLSQPTAGSSQLRQGNPRRYS